MKFICERIMLVLSPGEESLGKFPKLETENKYDSMYFKY